MNTIREGYPYPKSRVYWSATLAILSIFLAFLMLRENISWLLNYVLSTSAATVVTFLLKMRLYPFIAAGQRRETEQSETETDRASRRILLLAFFMMLLLLLVPLLLASFLSGPAWVIMIASFTSGVSISEIVLYSQTRVRK